MRSFWPHTTRSYSAYLRVIKQQFPGASGCTTPRSTFRAVVRADPCPDESNICRSVRARALHPTRGHPSVSQASHSQASAPAPLDYVAAHVACACWQPHSSADGTAARGWGCARLWKGNSKAMSVMRVSASVHQIHSASARGVSFSIFFMNAILLKLPCSARHAPRYIYIYLARLRPEVRLF